MALRVSRLTTASHTRSTSHQIVRAGLACILIAAGCATGGSQQLPGPRVAATATQDRQWSECLRFSRPWEEASSLSPTPHLSAHSVALRPTCIEAW